MARCDDDAPVLLGPIADQSGPELDPPYRNRIEPISAKGIRVRPEACTGYPHLGVPDRHSGGISDDPAHCSGRSGQRRARNAKERPKEAL